MSLSCYHQLSTGPTVLDIQHNTNTGMEFISRGLSDTSCDITKDHGSQRKLAAQQQDKHHYTQAPPRQHHRNHSSGNFPFNIASSGGAGQRLYASSRRHDNGSGGGRRELTSSGRQAYDWQSLSWSSSNPTKQLPRQSNSFPEDNHIRMNEECQILSPPANYRRAYNYSPLAYIDIYSHPKDVSVTLNGRIVLVCEARIMCSSDRPIYQWYKDEEPLIGEVESTYEKQGVTREDLGYYVCVVSDVTGSIQRKSRQACVSLNDEEYISSSCDPCPPYIIEQPEQNIDIVAGERLHLKLLVQANPEPAYRWFRNSVELPYAIGSELVVPCVTSRDEGQYICSIKNEFGSVLTHSISVKLVSKIKSTSYSEFDHVYDMYESKIAFPPSYSVPTSPRKHIIKQSSFHHPSHTEETLISDSVLSIVCTQLRRQMNQSRLHKLALCLNVPVYDLATIRVSYSSLSDQVFHILLKWRDSTEYCDIDLLEDLLRSEGFLVSLPHHQFNSHPGQIEGDAPVIIEHPDCVQCTFGDTATMRVMVDDPYNCRYLWYKDGLPLHNQKSSLLYIGNVNTTSQGAYHCLVSNCYGYVKSSTAYLDVVSCKVKLPPSLQRGNQSTANSHPNYLYISSTEKLADYQPMEVYPRKESGDTSSLPSLDSLGSTHLFANETHYGLTEKFGSLHLMEDIQRPVIVTQPLSQSIAIGDPLHLMVECSTKGNIQYNWYFNGLALPKEIEPDFILNCFTEDDVGDYYCILSNSYGMTKSVIAQVTLAEEIEDERVDEDVES